MHRWTLNEDDSRVIIKQALDLGINFFDTAIGYQNGTSEMFVGRALRDFAKREDVVVATKFTPRTPDEIKNGVSGQEHVRNCLNASLEHLGMDYVDLYILHMWDWNTPIEEYLEALDEAVKAGKVRAIGVSNCFAWQLAEANAIAEKNGWTKFVSIQSHYNLIMREDERELITYCKLHGISLTPYSALAAGRLSRKPGDTSKRMELDQFAKSKYANTEAQDNIIIERVAELAEKHGVTMTEVSLAWLYTKVDSPVCGATKMHHLEAPVKALDLELTVEEIADLEEAYVPHALSGVMATNVPKL